MLFSNKHLLIRIWIVMFAVWSLGSQPFWLATRMCRSRMESWKDNIRKISRDPVKHQHWLQEKETVRKEKFPHYFCCSWSTKIFRLFLTSVSTHCLLKQKKFICHILSLSVQIFHGQLAGCFSTLTRNRHHGDNCITIWSLQGIRRRTKVAFFSGGSGYLLLPLN